MLHFAKKHEAAEAAQHREQAIVHQLISLDRHVRSKYKNTLLLKGAFPLKHWEQSSSLMKQAGTDLFLLTRENPSTSRVSSSACSIPQPRQQLNTTDSFLYALFHLMWQQTYHSKLRTPHFLSHWNMVPKLTDLDTHNKLALIKHMLSDNVYHVANKLHSHCDLPLRQLGGYKQPKPESSLVFSWGAQTATTLQAVPAI